jgi:hypothetical protein
VDRIISSTWRLKRLGRVETGILAFELYGELAERARREASVYTRTEGPDDKFVAQFLSRTIITDEQKHREATDKARSHTHLPALHPYEVALVVVDVSPDNRYVVVLGVTLDPIDRATEVMLPPIV